MEDCLEPYEKSFETSLRIERDLSRVKGVRMPFLIFTARGFLEATIKDKTEAVRPTPRKTGRTGIKDIAVRVDLSVCCSRTNIPGSE